MNKKMKLVLPFVVVIILVMSVLSAISLSDIRGYGTLINYVGIVRGASQRVIKLETNDMPNDELIEYVDGIMNELLTGEGQYGLVRIKSKVFNKQLGYLNEKWKIIKSEIDEVRNGEDKEKLLKSSEELFEIANDAVFEIQEYSGERSAELTQRLAVTAVCCLFVSIIVIINYVKKYFMLHKRAEVLAEQAGRDELTGALNAERFCEKAQEIIEQNPEFKFSVLYIDFENFKYINDVFGYECGDDILISYTKLMSESLQDKELLGRVMADRFLILRCYEEKQELIERQKAADRNFMNLKVLPDRHTMTVVCGFCCLEDTIEKLDMNGIINRANYAHKTVKNVPGEKYAFYNESIRQKMFEEIHIADEMEKALENREFVIFLQPKVSPHDGEIKSAEALVRWRTANGKFYLPDVFIPIFEKNHFISELDQYVFEEVCRFTHEWYEQGRKVVPVSVNVSKIRFYTADFVKVYTEIKNKYNIPDGMLEIEFTETAACENREYMIQIVKELHENGFLCSMDDFGTGYSSLGMLKDLAVDVLKLDASFFKKSRDTQRGRLIVRGVLQMVRSLNIKTVAEGIENENQVEFLKESRCDLIQGFYYYKPMPLADFEEIMDGWRQNESSGDVN